ncbi:hypothetical protein [Arthrobacter sp. H35-D1]|uniref:hypothetical protein n=1 Tax=Arthrobacter sp. H35-D1 TaxID=3046202 RepID=UPI0024BB2C19|nr:hypothetical protein [Arthrobacter sp. H35-D1]MDJ0313189.1 hypothetical protein [Arthrobacter sp. H35-D1]
MRIPLCEGGRVIEGRPAGDHGSRRVDPRTGVQERVEDRDVATAGGPVQWRLAAWTPKPGVDIGAPLGEHGNGCGATGKVAGPVRGHMQQGARHSARTALADPCGGRARLCGQKLVEHVDTSLLHGAHSSPRQGIANAPCLHRLPPADAASMTRRGPDCTSGFRLRAPGFMDDSVAPGNPSQAGRLLTVRLPCGRLIPT